MSRKITPRQSDLPQLFDLVEIGQAANEAAKQHVFDEFRSRKAPHTLRRYEAGLQLFVDYLTGMGVEAGDLANDPQAWRGITWGLVEGFRNWMVLAGYAVGTVNVRLSTIKTFAKLATKAEAITRSEYAMIRIVDGYTQNEKVNIDKKRDEAGIANRRGAKKERAVRLSHEQAEALKRQPDSPQGRRDRLMMCLLLDHGLRVSEVAGLLVQDVDLGLVKICFYRPKVNDRGCHELTMDSMQAAYSYLMMDGNQQQPDQPLLLGSVKGGALAGQMSTRAITERVRVLGLQLGVEGLSAHDCRHHAAKKFAEQGKSVKWMMEWFGWKSTSMAIRYIEAAKVTKI